MRWRGANRRDLHRYNRRPVRCFSPDYSLHIEASFGKRSRLTAVSEPLRSLASFERELEGAGDYRDAFRVALDGLTNNIFTRSLRGIDLTSLPTLEMCYPEVYATIKDRRIREALVASGLFQVARHRGPRAVENLEIWWDWRPDVQSLLRAVERLITSRYPATPPPGERPGQPYMGLEAVKVFLRALDAVIGEIGRSDWERFDVLHRIAHGTGRRHGTPLDEIRVCGSSVRSLTKALKRISRS